MTASKGNDAGPSQSLGQPDQVSPTNAARQPVAVDQEAFAVRSPVLSLQPSFDPAEPMNQQPIAEDSEQNDPTIEVED